MAGLKRHIGLLPLILYGVGDILGSGIYGLVGKLAGQLGNFIWIGFLAAFLVALTTGLSYAALGARYPRAAGGSFIVWKAFRSPLLAFVVGLATLCSGLTSMAAAARIFAGYLNGMAAVVPVWGGISGFCLLLAGIVFIGIRQSLWVNAICTLVELGGLLLVVAAGLPYLGQVSLLDVASIPGGGGLSPTLALSGAVLAFYSFVGFEDMLNVSEEVVKPERNVPLGLLISLLIASAVYMLIGVVAVSVVPVEKLAASGQPLLEVIRTAWPSFPTRVFSVIALFAVANTALLNFIMCSRLLYGLAGLGLLPRALAKVHGRTRTPGMAVGAVVAMLMALAFVGDVAALARATSIFILSVFIAMSASLFVFQRRERAASWHVPQFIPVAAALGAAAMLLHAEKQDYLIAAPMLALILILYFIKRPTAEQIEKFEADPA